THLVGRLDRPVVDLVEARGHVRVVGVGVAVLGPVAACLARRDAVSRDDRRRGDQDARHCTKAVKTVCPHTGTLNGGTLRTPTALPGRPPRAGPTTARPSPRRRP